MAEDDNAGAELQPLAGGPATAGNSIIERMVAGLPSGPRESELIRLCVLARDIAAAAGHDANGPVMNFHQAGRAVVKALLGEDEYAGEPAAQLQVFHIYTAGPRALSDFVDEVEEMGKKLRYPSERERTLRDLSLKLLLNGCQIQDAPVFGAAWLAVRRDEALRAFGLERYLAALDPAAEPQLVLVDSGSRSPAAGRDGEARTERERHYRDRYSVARSTGENWSNQHRLELLQHYEFLTGPGKGRLKAAAAQALLTEKWGSSANTLRRELTTARGLRAGAVTDKRA